MDISSITQWTRKRLEAKKPFSSLEDERFYWLKETFMPFD